MQVPNVRVTNIKNDELGNALITIGATKIVLPTDLQARYTTSYSTNIVVVNTATYSTYFGDYSEALFVIDNPSTGTVYVNVGVSADNVTYYDIEERLAMVPGVNYIHFTLPATYVRLTFNYTGTVTITLVTFLRV